MTHLPRPGSPPPIDVLAGLSDAEIRKLAEESPRMRRKFWKEMAARIASLDENYCHPTFGKVAEGLICESDRGLVLVAAALLDEELKGLFREAFRMLSDNDARENEIEFLLTKQPLPPLQSAAIKLRLAGALGLIDRHTMEAGLVLQNIRSKVAAHSQHVFVLTRDHSNNIVAKFSDSDQGEYANLLRDMCCDLKAYRATEESLAFALAAMVVILDVRDQRELMHGSGDLLGNQSDGGSK
jgi:DNA-binding MltR family transcriptional regulator